MNMDEQPIPEEWYLELSLDTETRLWTINGCGPAGMLKHLLVDQNNSVADKLEQEATFDAIMLEYRHG